MNKIFLKNCKIYDGLGTPHIHGGIAINQGRISAVGQIAPDRDAEVIDLNGNSVAPGFIDAHAHSDISILASPEAYSRISQGITTEISGNCGLSAFPVMTDEVRTHLNGLYQTYGVELSWNDFRGFADEYDRRRCAVNGACLCGFNTLRANVLGYDDRPVSPENIERMRGLLRAMLAQGAAGLSTGLLYIPGKFSTHDELCSVATVLSEFDRIHATHLRSEGDRILEAIDEAADISRSCGRLEISHLKIAHARNWYKMEAVFKRIETLRAEGMKVTADRYPYTFGQTTLSVILPSPYDNMTDVRIQSAMRESAENRARALADLRKLPYDWTHIILCFTGAAGYEKIFGKNMEQAAEILHTNPSALTIELMEKDAVGTMAAFGGLSPSNLERVLEKPYVCAGTDESSRPLDESLGRSHPRGFGGLAKFVRCVADKFGFAEAVRRVTSLPAEIFQLRDRGTIAPGMIADLTVFDEKELNSSADFSAPHTPASGIRKVFVNGTLSFENGSVVARCGKMIRMGKNG